MHEKWTDEFLEAKRYRADPAADRLIAQVVVEKGPAAARSLFDILVRRVEMPVGELPEPVQEFVGTHGNLPAWADPEKIKSAEALFLDHGPMFLLFLYFKSLPTLYTNAKGAEVLYHTARLTHNRRGHEIFSRRVAETGQFLIDVMTEKGLAYNPFVSSRGLLDGGTGVQTAVKIRLIHASIRHFIPRDKWDEGHLGKPINQEDLAMTLMTFSVSMLEGMDIFKLDYSPEQGEAYLHAWKVVGHLLGIDADLLPENIAEGKALLNRCLERQAKPSEAGRSLTTALLAFADQAIPKKAFKNAPSILIKHLVGDEYAELLGVNTRHGCLSFLLPAFMKKALGLAEKLEDISPTLDQLMARLSLDMVHHLVNYFNQYKETRFRVPSEMRSAWNLPEDSPK